MATEDYRAKIYSNYRSIFQNMGSDLNMAEARRWGKAYDYYLRGWLPIEKNKAIADIGCGGGRFLLFLIERGYTNVQGVDISGEQLGLAKQVIKNVHHGDATVFLSNHSGSFDLIVALDFIEHLKKDEFLLFLKAAFESLNKGGMIVVQTPNAGSPFFGEMRYNDLSHEICFNANSIRRLLSLQGFSEIRVREAGPIPWGYSTASAVRYLGWICLRGLLKCWNLLEIGTTGAGIFTRNLIAAGRKIEIP